VVEKTLMFGSKRAVVTAVLAMLMGLGVMGLSTASAQEAAAAPTSSAPPGPDPNVQVMLDTAWTLLTAFLVFWMNAGFGCVESGLCRAKNAANILAKNFVVFGISTVAYWAVGFAFMFGDGNSFLGWRGWLVPKDSSPVSTPLKDLVLRDIQQTYGVNVAELAEKSPQWRQVLSAIEEQEQAARYSDVREVTVQIDLPDKGTFQKTYTNSEFYQGCFSSLTWAKIPLLAKFFFQLVFAGTAATIVSGCVAERIHYWSFMIFTVFLAGFSYPVTGHWIWGGGWLSQLEVPFVDFAGSTVVHSVGGWAGLAGILLLGPRMGKYGPDGKPRPVPGHSMALVFLGGMILWLGWFGFNPGSFMALNVEGISHVAMTTNLACCTGLIAATLTAWILLGNPDFSMTVNGALAGLVAITAPCAFVSVPSAAVIGAVAGILVVLGVLMFDRLRIDDPVGALSVHLLNGVWGTLAVGLFADQTMPGGCKADGLFVGGGWELLATQALGVVSVGAFTLVGSLLVWSIIKANVGLRVEPEKELVGLDISEMGMEAYPPEPEYLLTAPPVPGYQTPRYEPAWVAHEEVALDRRKAPTPGTASRVPPVPSRPVAAAAPEGRAATAAAVLEPRRREVARFAVVIERGDVGAIRKRWQELCARPDTAPAEFRDVYAHLVSFQSDRLRFRDAVPEEIVAKLERLFQGFGGPGVRFRVEETEY
jgi:Amt family ammonium transporter